MTRAHRNTICVEDAQVLEQRTWPGDQFVLRLAAADCAQRAVPGSFAHLRCADDLPMRRPLSIMRADASAGWIEVLYKVVGQGLARLATVEPGDSISVLGPIGNGFSADSERNIAVMIGGGVGIPPLVFLAERVAAGDWPDTEAVAFFGSELEFPFDLVDAARDVPGMPGNATASLAQLESWSVPCRLATLSGFPGCFDG